MHDIEVKYAPLVERLKTLFPMLECRTQVTDCGYSFGIGFQSGDGEKKRRQAWLVEWWCPPHEGRSGFIAGWPLAEDKEAYFRNLVKQIEQTFSVKAVDYMAAVKESCS